MVTATTGSLANVAVVATRSSTQPRCQGTPPSSNNKPTTFVIDCRQPLGFSPSPWPPLLLSHLLIFQLLIVTGCRHNRRLPPMAAGSPHRLRYPSHFHQSHHPHHTSRRPLPHTLPTEAITPPRPVIHQCQPHRLPPRSTRKPPPHCASHPPSPCLAQIHILAARTSILAPFYRAQGWGGDVGAATTAHLSTLAATTPTAGRQRFPCRHHIMDYNILAHTCIHAPRWTTKSPSTPPDLAVTSQPLTTQPARRLSGVCVS